jgi:general secretion pathway protein F
MSSSDPPIMFDYQALDPAGKQVSGQLTARSPREAHRALESRSLVPFALSPSKAAAARRKLFQRLPSERDNALLMEQLALLLTAGIPLLDAVASLRAQSLHPSFTESLAVVERRLRGGEAFAPTLATAFPRLPGYLGQLAAAGEATGRLGRALQDGVVQMNYDLTVQQEIRNALTYPLILVITGMGAVMFIFTVVVPRFSSMLAGKTDQLPLISKIVLELGLAFNAAKGPILILAAAMAAGMVFLSRDPRVRRKIRDWLDRVPLVGTWLLESELSRWGSMLSTMMANGIDLVRGLQFARESVSLVRLNQKLEQVSKLVRAGQSLSAAIASQDIFTPTAVSLIQVGETSGELSNLLKSMADLYANSGRQRMKRFLIMLEPIAILLIGGVIGGIVAAIMLAITSVNQVAL